MDFYHDLITEKSWQLLQKLRKKYDFILIGGWAVFLYTRALKSKDVDLILEYPELERLKEEFEVSKNDRLKKYEARQGEMEIDIYTPFYSNPGLPAEDLKRFKASLEGFIVAEKEVLAILKQKALTERQNTIKGRKDLVDLVSLFRLENFDWQKYQRIVAEYELREYLSLIHRILQETRELEELGLNVHQMARLKKKILSFLI